MDLVIRRSVVADVPAARRLGDEAFGAPATPRPAPEPGTWPSANVRPWSAYDGEELVATLGVRRFTSWFHGAAVPTAGFAGVTVAAERRGEGVLRPLFDAALAEAREQGEVISTLYPSAAGIYRSLGYEVIGSYDEARLPMAALATVRPPAGGVRTRRAAPADVEAIRAVYRTWAAAQNGPLTRTEKPFLPEPDELFGLESGYTGISLAVGPDDEVLGFASWNRGSGYDGTGTIEVDDLVALTPDAARALWRVLGSFGTVAGSVRLSTSGAWTGSDPSRLVLPDHTVTTTSRPYMLRLLDVPAALGTACLPPLSARVPFSVVDPRTPDVEGSWTLLVHDGVAQVHPDAPSVPAAGREPDRLTFTSSGIALSYAGAASTANLRLAGHVRGPSTHDRLWDALWHGRDVHVRDYF
ncbi:putative acetyltransferase [Isoptericola sp. CG 20/1183]|uniref:Acetyltransferase n=1 Tax=Isoptericola halotolerans TaxID=300560 RepID=A0ABX5EC13_9MICO|nr:MULTISPECIES: GNAT family N-acetyltransferase [Isoptericola]PRZ05110.1 putative acetyltransferase [Isoptericola halotolerans]PRZ05848.1 putative acetyltransferase [Isoptericola sp. CG 20/1183]